jgi:hypothetical protein
LITMGDKQNPRLDEEESSPASADGSEREKGGEAPRSYYYDDATGYEIYEEEDETDEDGDEHDG